MQKPTPKKPMFGVPDAPTRVRTFTKEDLAEAKVEVAAAEIALAQAYANGEMNDCPFEGSQAAWNLAATQLSEGLIENQLNDEPLRYVR